MQEHVQHSASPLPQNHDALDAQIRGLFTSNHLGLLLSEFYEARGMTDASKAKYPLILSLINIIKPQYSSQTTFEKNSLTRECYLSALTTYHANLFNMWAEKKMLKLLFDKLLLVLLRIYLSPSGEKKHQAYINTYTEREKERQKKKSKESQLPPQGQKHAISVLPSDVGDEERAEGSKRLVISVGSLSAKPLKIKSSKSKEPMRSSLEESALAKQVSEEAALPPSPDDYSSVEKVDMIEEEDTLRDSSHDASRRRIFEMKGLIESLLLADNDLTRESLMDKHADFAEHEIDACLLIVTRLKSCIPSKANYGSIGHQLPFVILANDLLRCAGYARFNCNICFMSTASLKAFRMNAKSLYSLYCKHRQ
ncbi:hypothetical protein BD560DRAFT_492595 [Blakeslea trispora]|nr:hypothetical protein BD560DRAFT_492595 [Blakeslea trispora]